MPIRVGAIPTRIQADASCEWVSGACGINQRMPVGLRQLWRQRPGRSSRGPGSHCAGAVSPLAIQDAAMGSNRASTAVRTRGVLLGADDLGASPTAVIMSANASGPPRRVDDDRQPRASPDGDHLAERREHPGEIGDRRRAPTQRRRTTAGSRIDERGRSCFPGPDGAGAG